MSKLSLIPRFFLGAIAASVAQWTLGEYRTYAGNGTCQQSYPNVPGRLLLENDKVVVQRFLFPPNQWECVHVHPANQIYIHLTDAHWKVRFGDKIESGSSTAGSVGWYGPVYLSEDHESVNIGNEPIELIWVTLKEGCGGPI